MWYFDMPSPATPSARGAQLGCRHVPRGQRHLAGQGFAAAGGHRSGRDKPVRLRQLALAGTAEERRALGDAVRTVQSVDGTAQVACGTGISASALQKARATGRARVASISPFASHARRACARVRPMSPLARRGRRPARATATCRRSTGTRRGTQATDRASRAARG